MKKRFFSAILFSLSIIMLFTLTFASYASSSAATITVIEGNNPAVIGYSSIKIDPPKNTYLMDK